MGCLGRGGEKKKECDCIFENKDLVNEHPKLFTTNPNEIIKKTEKLMIEFMGIDDETGENRAIDDFAKNWEKNVAELFSKSNQIDQIELGILDSNTCHKSFEGSFADVRKSSFGTCLFGDHYVIKIMTNMEEENLWELEMEIKNQILAYIVIETAKKRGLKIPNIDVPVIINKIFILYDPADLSTKKYAIIMKDVGESLHKFETIGKDSPDWELFRKSMFEDGLMEEFLEIPKLFYENGLVYLDLKPENTLISTDGKINLIDFDGLQFYFDFYKYDVSTYTCHMLEPNCWDLFFSDTRYYRPDEGKKIKCLKKTDMHALTNMCYGFCAKKQPNYALIDEMKAVGNDETMSKQQKIKELEELSEENRDELMKSCQAQDKHSNTDYKHICDAKQKWKALGIVPFHRRNIKRRYMVSIIYEPTLFLSLPIFGLFALIMFSRFLLSR